MYAVLVPDASATVPVRVAVPVLEAVKVIDFEVFTLTDPNARAVGLTVMFACDAAFTVNAASATESVPWLAFVVSEVAGLPEVSLLPYHPTRQVYVPAVEGAGAVSVMGKESLVPRESSCPFWSSKTPRTQPDWPPPLMVTVTV